MSYLLKPRRKGCEEYACNNSKWVWLCEAGFFSVVGFMPIPGSEGNAYLLVERDGKRPDANDGFIVTKREAQLIGWLAAQAVDGYYFLNWSIKTHRWPSANAASDAIKAFSEFCLASGGFEIT